MSFLTRNFRTKAENGESWRGTNFCVIDVETTGLDLKRDEIISIGMVAVEDGRICSSKNFYTEIAPSQKPSIPSIKVHGLRSADLQGSKTFADAAPEIVAKFQNQMIVGHALWVERAFLTAPLKLANFTFPKRVIDTAALARATNRADLASDHEPSLEYLARSMKLPVYSPHHALGDAMTTSVVFLALAAEIEKSHRIAKNRELSVLDLLEISEQFAKK
ncbi:MAG: 3'-5' exonuclease [Actinomycetes bacterium]